MNLSVRVFKNHNNSKIKANVSVVIEDAFVIKDIKVIQGTSGLFVAMPSRPKMDKGEIAQEDGKNVYLDIFHPITKEAREQLITAVLEAYEKAE